MKQILNKLNIVFRDEHCNLIENSMEMNEKDSLKNAFSNDGSFLDQFKKLSKSGVSSNIGDEVQVLAENLESSSSNGDCEVYPEKNIYNTDKHLILPSPGMIQLDTQSEKKTVPQTLVNPSTRNIPSLVLNKDTKSMSSSYSKAESSKPSFETDTFDPTQKKSFFTSSNPLQISRLPQNVYSSPANTQNIHSFPSKKTELKTRFDTVSMTFKSNPLKKLEIVSNPLGNDDADEVEGYKLKESQLCQKVSEKFDNINASTSQKTLCEENSRSKFSCILYLYILKKINLLILSSK